MITSRGQKIIVLNLSKPSSPSFRATNIIIRIPTQGKLEKINERYFSTDKPVILRDTLTPEEKSKRIFTRVTKGVRTEADLADDAFGVKNLPVFFRHLQQLATIQFLTTLSYNALRIWGSPNKLAVSTYSQLRVQPKQNRALA